MDGKKKTTEIQKKTVIQKRAGKKPAGGSERQMCPAAEKCGGCAYQGLPYEIQLEKKQRYMESLLKNICPVRPIIGMDNPYNYRNKVHAVFGRLYDGTILSGTYEKNSHRIVPIESCMIEDACADAIIRDIRGLLKSFKIKIYNEDSGFGLFRHVLIRRGFATGQVLVVLVTASPVFPSKNNFVKALLKLHPEITSIVLNINNKNTSMILGEREIVLYGKGYIEDVLCGRTFRISPKSFYQVNPVQTEVLYRKAIELAGLTGKERVIDAYCGIGTIGIIMSRYAGEVIGVELNPDAVRDAKANAKRNEIHNIRFFQNDAGKFMLSMAEQGKKADIVFMDPPRTGSDEAFLSSVVKLNPKRIVYISCGPETLARDLKYLVKRGYRAEEAWPVDLFPWTGHVETVVLLSQHRDKNTCLDERGSRQIVMQASRLALLLAHKPDDTIEIDLDLDELDATSAELKATYQEIKDYV